MQVGFRLRPLDQIKPFGRGPLRLHWFGLSDGWYWIDVGGSQLFRYSEPFMAHAEPRRSNSGASPYVDYYVVRLWEDLLDLLPTILSPVPDPLARRLADAADWRRWERLAQQWVEREDEEAATDAYATAISWWNERHLHTGYLRHGPQIAFWRAGETIHLRWDNAGLTRDGMPIWSAHAGEAAFPVDAFLGALRAFDRQFIAAMARQVDAAYAPRGAAIYIDTEQLTREHADRARWCERGIAASLSGTTGRWDGILEAITQIEASVSWRASETGAEKF